MNGHCPGRTGDRQNVAHIRRECCAKILGIARHETPLVPLDDIMVSQRFSPMSDSSDLQPVTVGPEYGRDDGDPLPGFSEREQCVRRAALEQNIGFDIRETASCVK